MRKKRIYIRRKIEEKLKHLRLKHSSFSQNYPSNELELSNELVWMRMKQERKARSSRRFSILSIRQWGPGEISFHHRGSRSHLYRHDRWTIFQPNEKEHSHRPIGKRNSIFRWNFRGKTRLEVDSALEFLIHRELDAFMEITNQKVKNQTHTYAYTEEREEIRNKNV